jgi:4-amino-4-deoxy-L-arabinose transferase-like glycosyltransferase
VLVFSAVIPFGLLALGVVVVAWRLFGSRAALLSLVCLGASPGMLRFGSMVFVETFMSLWILLIFYSMAVLVNRPSSAFALLLGAALALALLTKLTIALLLLGAALYSLCGYLRRHPIDAAFTKAIACVVLPVFVLAGPWYLKNGRSAVDHAFFSARFTAFTGGVIKPTGQRLILLAENVCGWPLFLAIIAVGLWTVFLRRGSTMLPDGAGRTFIKVTTIGFALGAAILLRPSYFEARFLLPAWPAMAIVVGAFLQGFIGESRPWRSAVTASVLAISLGWSIASLYGQPRRVTYWNLDGVIQKLVTEHNVTTLGALGDTPDWNIFKVRLINDLTNAEARLGRWEILDLSRGSPDDVKHKLDRIDALAMLERSQISDQCLREAPNLNRNYTIIDEAFRKRPEQFAEVGADSNVPPRFRVYVRRRRSEPSL